MKKFKILLFSSLLMTMFSCKKLLDVKETDFIGGEIALKTVLNNEQGIIGAYSLMNIEMGIGLNAVFSDELVTADFYNAASVHEWQYGTQDVAIRDNYTAVRLYYQIIDRVNRVLQALPTATAANAAEEAIRSRVRGEALFLRAFCHFELYRYYSNSSVGTDLAMAYMESPSLQPTARITVAPYFQKLKADLLAAKPLLPAYSSSATSITLGRANQMAVTALQARVALYLKEWNDATTFSTEYINAIPLASKANFGGIWTDANNSEVAFKLIRSATNGPKIGNLFRGNSTATNIGVITWTVSQKLWDMYDQTNDIRFTTYYKNEPLLVGAGRKYSRLIKKYEGTAYGSATENVADAKVFRTGEMYLIRAEAKAENNDLIGAASDLNALRDARINNYVPIVLATKSDAINAIMDERFKELPYEGHRFWDLKRKNLPVVRLAADLSNPTAPTTLPAGNFRFLLPIPSTEIQANPLIQQNPGYSN
jgi:starch-binding outer membrane protein, SusD/RagB family